MQVKQSPCCARFTARLVMEEANLRRLAQRASYRAAKGLSTAELQEKIDANKVSIQQVKDAIVEHEAQHAGGAL